jgi:hypothetical protein
MHVSPGDFLRGRALPREAIGAGKSSWGESSLGYRPQRLWEQTHSRNLEHRSPRTESAEPLLT